MNVVILLLFINFSFKFAIFSVLIENKLEKVDYIYTYFTFYSLKSQNVNAISNATVLLNNYEQLTNSKYVRSIVYHLPVMYVLCYHSIK